MANWDDDFGPYRPRKKTAAILARAMEHFKSVPYTVSARWLFYRLLQEGHYTEKDDYKNKFIDVISKARKREYMGWRPWSLSDDTREPIYRSSGFKNPSEWLELLGSQVCCLDKTAARPCYIEIWYEARAMTSQFEYYTKDVTLRPFGGQPSIPFKWEIARHLMKIRQEYPDKPIKILYFGDNDKAGNQIPMSAVSDIEFWCESKGVHFDFCRVGLNDGQEIEFNIPENFEKPGTYQWEALTDAAARTIITRAISQIPDMTAKDEMIEEMGAEVTEKFKRLWPTFIEMMDAS